MNIKFGVLLALFGVLAKTTTQQEQQAQVFCGRKLSATLAMLCENGFLLTKKSGPALNSVYENDGLKFWPWIPPHQARSMGIPSRGKRGIIEECCEKPCTISELMTYCQ